MNKHTLLNKAKLFFKLNGAMMPGKCCKDHCRYTNICSAENPPLDYEGYEIRAKALGIMDETTPEYCLGFLVKGVRFARED